MAVVLIAEDNPDLRGLLRLLVEMEGCTVVEAADGCEAVECAHTVHPDLIFMDIAMPRMDGIQACKKIRATRDIESVPIIAVTAHNERFQEAREAGCNDCMPKPLSDTMLYTMLQKYLKSSLPS